MDSSKTRKDGIKGKIKKFFSGRRKFWILLVLIIVGVLFAKANSFRKQLLVATHNQAFRLAKVARGPIEVTVTGTGSIKPHRRWELSTLAGGKVVEILAQPGDCVKEGQILAKLETEELLLQVEDAALELKIAQNTLSEFEDKLSWQTVKSPSQGVLTDLFVEQGESVREGQQICNISSSHMKVKSFFNESQVQNIVQGQKSTVFFMDFLSDIQGTVEHVSQTGEAREGGVVLYPVTIEIERQGALIPGMSAIVKINTAHGVVKSAHEDNQLIDVVKRVNAKTDGTISKVSIREGDLVKTDQILLEMETQYLETQIETQHLKTRHARNKLNSLEEQLKSQTITAPVDSTVLNINAQVGDTLAPNSIIAIVADLSLMEVTLPIDEIDTRKIRPGQTASITAEAVPGKQFPGEILNISHEAQSIAGIATFDAKILVESDDNLMSGMSCDVVINTDSKADTLLLPIEALQSQNDEYVVWAIPNLADRDIQQEFEQNPMIAQKILSEAELKTVEVGLISPSYAEILGGLKEGDTVIVFIQDSGPFGPGHLNFHFP